MSEPSTTIEQKKLSAPQTDAAMVTALRGRRGELTRADAVTASGLPTHMVDESLERLLKEYKSHLAVTEDGELLYSFDPAFVRRGEISFREKLRAVGRWLTRAGMLVFKAWIAVTLVVYVVVFVVLLIAAMFGGKSDDRRDSRGGGFGWIWLLFLPDWRYGGYGRHDAWGRRLPSPARGREKSRKPFLSAVYDFVFGPPRPAVDALADEREILGYLRANDGRVTATDLVTMFGWGYRRAEEEATRLLVDYDGEPEITSDGVLVYAFPQLLKSGASGTELAATSWKPAWKRVEERPKLTDNPGWMDGLIAAFAGFNLIMSFVGARWVEARYGLGGPGWQAFFTTFPLIFFTLFLGIPGVRAVTRKIGDRRRAREASRREALREILAADGGPLPMRPALKELALPFEGEMDVNEAGEAVIDFPRVREERRALKKHLASVDTAAERRIGPKIFDSEK